MFRQLKLAQRDEYGEGEMGELFNKQSESPRRRSGSPRKKGQSRNPIVRKRTNEGIKARFAKEDIKKVYKFRDVIGKGKFGCVRTA